MNFWDKIFNRKNNYNNFSEFGLPEINIKLKGDKLSKLVGGLTSSNVFDLLNINGALKSSMEKRNISYISTLSTTKIYENGFLEIPLLFEVEEKKYSLFIIYNELQARKFNDIKSVIKKTDYPNSLYISTINIDNIKSKVNCIEPLKISNLRYVTAQQQKELSIPEEGDYCIWWASNSENSFNNSKTNEILKKIYQTINGYEEYMWSYLLFSLNLIKKETEYSEEKLPEVSNHLFVRVFDKTLAISASKEKGILFHFNQSNSSILYLENFLSNILLDFKEHRNRLEKNSKTQKKSYNCEDWFKMLLLETKENEEKNKTPILLEKISVTHRNPNNK